MCILLTAVTSLITRQHICIGSGRHIWTLTINERGANTPLVLLHGVGSGVALWVLNLESIALSGRPIYAIDVLGFGLSSHVDFSTDPTVAEMELIESLEAWRQAVKLDNFILLGHCFGGYLAASYTIRYPSHVHHLILVDPWGFPEQDTREPRIPIPLWVKVLLLVIQPFYPFSLLRTAGSWGEWIAFFLCNEYVTYF